MLYPHNIEQKIGFDTVRQLISGNCLSDLAKEEIDAITFFSLRTAVSFIENIIKMNLSHLCKNIDAFVISNNIKEKD